MNKKSKSFARRAAAALFACALGAVSAFAQGSVITDLELRSGGRGIIFTISGSGPIAIGGNAESLASATARYTDVRLKISKARWSPISGQSSFMPPDNVAVKEIAVKEAGDGVEILIRMRSVTDGPIQIRDSDNQVRMLLTKTPQPEVIWTAAGAIGSAAPAPAAQPQPQPQPQQAQAKTAAAPPQQQARPAPTPDVTIPSDAEASRVLGDVRIVERDNTAALYFDFSAPPSAMTTRMGDSLRITFADAALSPKLLTQPYNVAGSSYPRIRLARGRGSDGKSMITAVVRLPQGGAAPVTAVDGDRYVVRIGVASKNQVFLWSALLGVKSSQQFADIKPEPVDMKKMEARAARDTQAVAGGQLFSVKDGAAQAAAAPQRPNLSQPQLAAKPETPAVQEFHDSTPPAVSPKPGEALVRYKVYGRDPFIPLVRDPNDESELPSVENLRLVGVLEDSRERIALLEDFSDNNRAYALRVGDPVEYGKVLRVYRDRVVFLIRDFDVSRSYTLGISRDAESGRARR